MQLLLHAFHPPMWRRESSNPAENAAAADLAYSKAINATYDKQWSTALDLFNSALIIQRKAYGMDHPLTARTLNEIGLVLHRMGELFAALTAFEEALFIRQETLGAGHPDVVEITNNMCRLLDEAKPEEEEEEDDERKKEGGRPGLKKSDENFVHRSMRQLSGFFVVSRRNVLTGTTEGRDKGVASPSSWKVFSGGESVEVPSEASSSSARDHPPPPRHPRQRSSRRHLVPEDKERRRSIRNLIVEVERDCLRKVAEDEEEEEENVPGDEFVGKEVQTCVSKDSHDGQGGTTTAKGSGEEQLPTLQEVSEEDDP